MRKPSVRYWKTRKVYYTQIQGQRFYLGPDKHLAHQRFHELMSQPQKRAVPSDAVVALIDQFLEWVQKHRAGETYEWYQTRLQQFADRYPDLRVLELKKFHITQWIDSFDVASGTKRNLARSIVRCLNWAEDEGLIDQNPIRRFRKPKGGKREIVILPEEFERILGAIKRQPFRDLVTFAWHTGARATECLTLEKSHVELANHRIVFPVEEEKMERAPRIIYLTEEAEDIVRRLMLRWPEGKLFRNTDGNPWTTDSVNCCFNRVRLKIDKKYCLTNIRHSFCHRLLKAGVDALTVSILMGHADPSMVAKVYGHLSHASDYLLQSLKRA